MLRDGNTRPPDLPLEKSADQEATVRTGHGTTDWFQSGKEYINAVYCHPAYLTYMQNTSWEMLGWKKHKLESRLLGELLITSDIQMTPPLLVQLYRSVMSLCDPMNCSTPGFPFHHQLPEFTQTQVGDAIQPSHPLSSPSPHNFNLSQHQGLFKWVSSSHQVAIVLKFQLQHQSFQWTPRTDLL